MFRHRSHSIVLYVVRNILRWCTIQLPSIMKLLWTIFGMHIARLTYCIVLLYELIHINWHSLISRVMTCADLTVDCSWKATARTTHDTVAHTTAKALPCHRSNWTKMSFLCSDAFTKTKKFSHSLRIEEYHVTSTTRHYIIYIYTVVHCHFFSKIQSSLSIDYLLTLAQLI